MSVPLTSFCDRLRPPTRLTSSSNSSNVSPNGSVYGDDGRRLVCFDIDNCLYSRHTQIGEIMQELIQRTFPPLYPCDDRLTPRSGFFESIGLSKEEATEMHSRYYKQYGLSVRGLIRHHAIDPLVYDRECDAALPLEQILKPDPSLRSLLQRIDTSKCRLWALTNAYRHHARRVLRLLDVEDLFEAVISCDYAHPTFRCKPEREYYEEAMEHTGVHDSGRIFFVDDSALNVRGAIEMGWNVVLFDEDGSEAKKEAAEAIPREKIISKLDELVKIWGADVFTPEPAKEPMDSATPEEQQTTRKDL